MAGKDKKQLDSYENQLRELSERSMTGIRKLCWNRLSRHLEESEIERVRKQLDRGRHVLESEEQLDAYMHFLAKKHTLKCEFLFKFLPPELFAAPFDLVDWGCGAGCGVIAMHDFLRRLKGHDIEAGVRSITLIEPSLIALKRAADHARVLFPEVGQVIELTKRFEKLTSEDFKAAFTVPRVHLLLNVLDLELFKDSENLFDFARLISQLSHENEYFICASPDYGLSCEQLHGFKKCLLTVEGCKCLVIQDVQSLKLTDGPTEASITAAIFRLESEKDASLRATLRRRDILDVVNLQRNASQNQIALAEFLCKTVDQQHRVLFRPYIDGAQPDALILSNDKVPVLIQSAKMEQLEFCGKTGSQTNDDLFIERLALDGELLCASFKALTTRVSALSNSGNACVVYVIFFSHWLQDNVDVKMKKMFIFVKSEIARLRPTPGQPVTAETRDRFARYRRFHGSLNKVKFIGKDAKCEWDANLTNRRPHCSPSDILQVLDPPTTYTTTIDLDSVQVELAESRRGLVRQISGVAGAGKTVVMVAHAVESVKRTHRPVLMLYSTITLHAYLENLVKQFRGSILFQLFHIAHYHRFAMELVRKIQRGHVGFLPPPHGEGLEVCDDVDWFVENKGLVHQYGAILIDECQNFKYEWLEIVKKACLEETGGEYLLFGDEKQNVYGRPLAQKRIKTNISSAFRKLRTCYRSNSEIYGIADRFRNQLMNAVYEIDAEEHILEKGELNLSKPGESGYKYFSTGGFLEAARMVRSQIETSGTRPGNVVVLGSSVDGMRVFRECYCLDTQQQVVATFEGEFEYWQVLSKFFEPGKAGGVVENKDDFANLGYVTHLNLLCPGLVDVLRRDYPLYYEFVGRQYRGDWAVCYQAITNASATRTSKALKSELDDVRRHYKNTFGDYDEVKSIKMSTIQSFQGLQAETVCLLLCPSNLDEVATGGKPNKWDKQWMEQMYTALTRARRNIFVLNVGAESDHQLFSELFV